VELPSPTGKTHVNISLENGDSDNKIIVNVYNGDNLNYLTDRIIKHYIYKHLDVYLTLFSVGTNYIIQEFNFIEP